MASKLAEAPARETAGPVFRALWELNQAFAAAGVVATGAAVVLWSIALIGGWLTLDVQGFGLFVLVQAIWGLAAAANMLWGRR